MKSIFFFAISFLIASSGWASEPYVYEFPGCSGGGGNWPQAILEIPQEICVNPEGENVQSYGGHCNGRLDLKVICEKAAVKNVDIKDCFCD